MRGHCISHLHFHFQKQVKPSRCNVPYSLSKPRSAFLRDVESLSGNHYTMPS